ncbi:MAG: GIY-YIG nuclease family protein [Bacteroidota bacterium]|jgi:putative endonuclease|nr:GIY-YIG nuclease family protein [Sphingobacteriales bacterium]
MKYWVYIIYSHSTDKRYIGQTADLTERIRKHNSGKNQSTKTAVPWVLFASLAVQSRTEALSMERKLKNLKSRARQNDFCLKNGFKFHEVIGPEK